MRLTYEHRSTRAELREKIEAALAEALDPDSQYTRYAKGFNYTWTGDKANFSLSAMGSNITGSVEVTDSEVIVDVAIPLLFRAFESKVKSRILQMLGESVG